RPTANASCSTATPSTRTSSSHARSRATCAESSRRSRPGWASRRSSCLERRAARSDPRAALDDGLTRLDAADVGVSGARLRRRVAPVALNLPGLGADGDEAVERPRALVGVLAALAVLPG